VVVDEVVFTSGATEALTQALYAHGPGRVVATSLEHPALGGAVRALGERSLVTVSAGLQSPPAGPLAAAALVADMLSAAGDEPSLLALMASHNVTGLVLPVEMLAQQRIGSQHRLLVDASQHAGRLPLEPLFAGPGRPDYAVLAPHKFGGPRGIGALIVAPGAPRRSLFPGGGQERGMRGGTEAVPLIAAFGAAARVARLNREAEAARLAALRDALAARLAAETGVAVVGADAARLPQTLCIIVPRHTDGETVVARMSRAGFALSAGSACATGSALPSPGLLALGLSPADAIRTVRISLGAFTTSAAVDALGTALIGILREV
jgi:cysteine desulfurase